MATFTLRWQSRRDNDRRAHKAENVLQKTLADPRATSEKEVGGGRAELERRDPEDKESCMSYQEFGFYSVPVGNH